MNRVTAVAALALFASLPAAAKPPYEIACPAEREVHLSYCCPESAPEAVEMARLLAATVCTDGGYRYYDVLAEDQEVDSSEVHSERVTFTKLLVTATLSVKLYPYEEVNAYRCADIADKAPDDKKTLKVLTRFRKDLAKMQAAGQCRWPSP